MKRFLRSVAFGSLFVFSRLSASGLSQKSLPLDCKTSPGVEIPASGSLFANIGSTCGNSTAGALTRSQYQGFLGKTTSETWYAETLYPEWQQRVRIDEVIEEEKSDVQDLIIFENSRFGRVLALDGVVQTTQADEFVYHEMMAHVPLIAHGNARDVLIIGGGDGGMLREVSRHKNIARIVMVEIDGSVVEFSKKYLPTLSNGAFEDPRFELIITDGAKFVKETKDRFDVIICDSTDPIGPGAVLFTQEFYGDCKNILNRGGIFVNQNGVPFLQGEELKATYERRKPYYEDTSFYLAPVPTYVGGFMAFGWAADANYRDIAVEELDRRMEGIEGELKYYNADIHRASFALPNFVKNAFL